MQEWKTVGIDDHVDANEYEVNDGNELLQDKIILHDYKGTISFTKC